MPSKGTFGNVILYYLIQIDPLYLTLWRVDMPPCMLAAQSCPTLSDSMGYSPPGSFVHEISQARILEWVVIPFSRGSSQSRDLTWVSCIKGRFFTIESPGKPLHYVAVVVQSLSHVQPFVSPWLQHSRPACPSPTPRTCSNSCPLSR